MVVHLLSRLDTPVAQSVPYVVQCVSLLGVHHPVGDTVPKRMGGHVTRITASAVDQVRLDIGLLGDLRDRVANSLGSDPVARPRRKQRGRIFPPAIQIR